MSVEVELKTDLDGISLGAEVPGWGYVGHSKTFVSIDDKAARTSSFGIERDCDPGEQYCGLLEVDGRPVRSLSIESVRLPLFWKVSEIGGRGKHKIDLEAVPPLQFTSLYDSSTKLRGQVQGSPANVELMDDLDHLFSLLAYSFSAVHGHGMGVGLVDPRNILYYFDARGEMRLALPDLFVFNNADGEPPNFVANRKEFAFLWADYDADLQCLETDNFTSNGEWIDFANRFLESSKSDFSRDARTLARIISWSMTGLSSPVWEAARGRDEEIWSVLKRADYPHEVEAPINSPVMLGQAIRGYAKSPTRIHRGEEPVVLEGDRTTNRPFRRRLWLAAVILGFLLIAAAYNFIEIPSPGKVYSLCENCESTSPVHDVLIETQQPLIADFLAEYGENPFPLDEDDERMVDDSIYGKAVTQELLGRQFANIQKQIQVLDELYADLERRDAATAGEMECLAAESRRIVDCIGKHTIVLYVNSDPSINALGKPADLVNDIFKLYSTFRTKPYFSDDRKLQWHRELEALWAAYVQRDQDRFPDWLQH